MRTLVLVTLLVAFSLVHAQYTKLYYFWPSETFTITLSTPSGAISTPTGNNCNCSTPAGWLTTCQATVSSNVATISLQIANTGGYCQNIAFTNGFATDIPVAFIEYLSITPVARPTYTGQPQSFILQTQPQLSFTQLQNVMQGSFKISSTLVSGVDTGSLTNMTASFTNAQVTQLAQESVLLENQYYMVDLALVDSQMSYSINQPLILYNQPRITSVTPKLARKNTNVNFNVATSGNGFDFTTNTGIVKVSTSAALGQNAVDGTLISSRQIQVVQQVTDFNNTFAVSLDGSQYDAQVSGFVEGFDFPPTNTITYTTPSDGIDTANPATGCSIFAFNYLNFSSPGVVKQPSNWGEITLRIKDEGFSRTGYCNWTIDYVNNNVTGFSCPCPELWDLNVGLPQTFTYELQFNGVDWYSSTSFSGAPQINYYAPKPFTTSPVGKLFSGSNNVVTISGLKNRYKPATLSYAMYGRGTGQNVAYSCSPTGNGDGYSCTAPFTSSMQDLCGCSSYQTYDYSNTAINCTCRANSGGANCPVTPTPTPTSSGASVCSADNVCTVSTIVSVNRATNPGTSAVEYTASTPYYIYGPIDCGDPRCSPRQVTPKNIPLGNTQRVDIYAIRGKFLNNGQLMYRLNATADTYMPLISTPSRVGVLNYVSDKQAYFTVLANAAQQYAMTLEISQNSATDFDTLSAQVIRFYDPTAITYSQIIGSQGVINSTLPADLAITIVGNNFFPSDNIYIRFDRQFVQLTSNCTFNSTTTLICITPNMLATGVFLPSIFSVSISYDTGSAYVNTGVNLQFEESIQPVIVQIVPPMGPINADPLTSKASPDGTYTISIKGLTNAVTGCAYVYPYNDTVTTPNIKGIITSGPNNQQVDCTVPVQALQADAKLRNIQFPAQYAVYLLTAIDTQKSEAFPFKFYMNPNLTSIYPSNVAAFGGDSVVITGPNLQEASDYTVGFKIVDTQSTSNCVPINSTAIRCTTPAHPDGKNLQVSITYNQYQFVSMPASVPFTVDPCPVGYSATDFTKKCQPCEAGRYKPLQGFFDCIDCEQGRYQSQSAQQLCVGCPRFTITPTTRSTNITQCDCQPGYFRPNNTLPGIDCNACPTGGNCTGLGFSPTPQPGYWYNTINSRPNTGSYIFDSCEPHPLRCTGDLSVNGGCATGRSGVLCGDCMSGWFKSGEDCKMCTDDVRLRFIIVVAVIIALVIVFFKFAQLKVAYLSSISIAVSYFQIIAVFSLYDFKWPQSLKNAIQVLQFINLNIDIVVPECISIITYGLKWGVTVSLPAIFGACLIAAFSLELMRSIIVVWTGPLLKPYIMNWYRIDNRNFVTKFCTEQRRDIAMFLCNPKNGPEMKEFSDMCIHTFMIIISFSYVFVITKASEIFNCQWVPESGLNIMVADTTVTCYQGVWWAYFPFSIGLIIAFGLGTILLFLYITLNRKKIVKDKVFNDRFRFLFVRFRNERLFWEAVIVIRKLLISVAIIFFAGYPMLVILFCMFVIFCSFILQTHHVPFRRVFHNIMEYVQLLATEFLLFAALLFYVDAFPDEWNKDALGYITIIVVVFCTVIIICLILLDVMSQIRRSWKTNHEAKLAKGAVAVSVVPAEDGGDVELPDVVVSPDSAPYQVLQSPTSPTSPTSPASTVNLLDIPETPAQNSLQNAPSFVLKVQQKLPKPHPKVAKATNFAWTRFTTFLDRIEGDDLDNIDWAKIKEQAEAEEARKALEEQQRLEKEKEIAQEVQTLDQLPPALDNSGDIELVDSPIHADEVIPVEEEITIDDSQYHNM